MACSSASTTASSEEEKKEQRLIDAMFLCDEWKSSKGGLSTFNRELAIHLAETTSGSMNIHCYVSRSDDHDREEAEQHGVNLITAQTVPGSRDPLDWLKVPPPELRNPHIVIGHGRKLGTPACHIARVTRCKWIQFVHVFCEDLGKFKESTATAVTDTIEENEERHKMEIELCKAADAVVAVGSRLQQKYSRSLPNVEVEIITPGIVEKFCNESVESREHAGVLLRTLNAFKSYMFMKTFNVFMFGRATFEDLTLKGYDIVANAIGSLGEEFELTFVGSSPGDHRNVEQWFLQKTCIKRKQITIRGYCTEQDELKEMFHQSDLVALPSRTEGFGLVGLEAISCGVPILVSGESGVAEALQNVEGGNTVIVGSDEDEWARRISEVSSQSPEERQANARQLRENYRKVYSWNAECERFNRLIENVVKTANGGEMNIKVDVNYLKPEEQNIQTGMLATETVRCHEVQQPTASATSPASGSVSYPKTDLQAHRVETFLSIIKSSFHSLELHSIGECNQFKEYAKEMKLIIVGASDGSLVITVKCESLMILEDLWTDYSSGHLGEVVQNCFVTEKILKELNLAELRLKATMDIEEYNACKMFFEKDALRDALSSEFHSTSSTSENPQKKKQWEKSEQETKMMETVELEGASSSEFHSISSTSESPQNQGELKKGKQKTKIVEREKMKDTSPLTVKSTTGHGKELIGKAQGRKGMLPLLRSSKSRDVEELHMKLQIMKGASSSEFHSISSTSESPQNQKELKKWKQKTKIVETEKLKDILKSVRNMSASIDIDEIDDTGRMSELMKSRGISTEGLQTLDQMKQRAKKALRISEEVFLALTEARNEVERTQRLLLELCVSTEACLNMMSDKDYALLEMGVKNLKNQLVYHKQRLEREEHVVLIAGERDPKKSTLLSLILGEQLLPDSFLSASSIICELRYGTTPRLIAHYKDADPETGLYSKTIQLSEMAVNSQQIFLQQTSSFFPEQDLQGPVFDKIEIFWPNNLLKERIVVVDSPGFEKLPMVDEKVKAYLSEAFAVICVIDSLAQQQRMEEPIRQCRRVCLDHLENSSIFPLFLCKNWDRVSQNEADSIKNHVVGKVREYWPELDPNSQIIYISSPHATNDGTVVAESALPMDAVKSTTLQNNKATLQMQWRWLDFAISRMVYHMKMVMDLLCPSTDRKTVSERLHYAERQLCSVECEFQEKFRKLTDDAVRDLSNHLQSCEVMEQFTSGTLDDIPRTGESWKETEQFIQDAFKERLQNMIAAWEEKNQILSSTRSSLVQLSHQRFDESKSLLPYQYLENPVIADGATSRSNTCVSSNHFGAAKKVMIGLTSPIWVPFGLVGLAVSVPVVGVMTLKEKVTNMKRSRKYGKDKHRFIVRASQKYLCKVAQEQQLSLIVEEQLKDVHVYLTKVSSRLHELLAADKILCQQLRDKTRSRDEIKKHYGRLGEMSVRVKEKMALFSIKELQSMEISCNDLEWDRDDPSSLVGNGESASVYRGTFRLPGQSEPTQVAVKLWSKELNESTAIGFLSKTETLRKLCFPLIVKFFGTALLKEGDRLRVIHVLELCEENLMNHIFQNPENKPAFSRITSAKNKVLCWAKDVAAAIEFIHNQGIVHRNFKLEKILLSQKNVVKVSGFRPSEEAKVTTDETTGTNPYLAPEVILSKEHDTKADIYSFGVMLWEMWYGERAPLEIGGHVPDQEAKGARPSCVQDAIMPPTGWQDLMQHCWDGKPHNRPDAAECHKLLTVLSQEVYTPPL